MLAQILKNYQSLSRNVKNAIAAQFSVQAVNSAFFLLLNYFMSDRGFQDFEIADVLSYRFLAVFLLAFPLGLYIRGRRLAPFFWIAVIGVSIVSQLLVLAIDHQQLFWVNFLSMCWGVVYIFIQVSIIPYILLNAPREQHSEAIALSFLSLGGTMFIIGTLYAVFSFLPITIDEKMTLQIVASLSLIFGVFFLSKIKGEEKLSVKIPFKAVARSYDWGLIFKALIPTIIIAIGAGFTIPVINLFFLNVHGIPSETFAALGSATWILVIVFMLVVPAIRRKFGYKVAITLFQSMAVLALFGLAATEWISDWTGAAFLACSLYVVRQPLMSAASPMASELTMYLVGKKNQEIMAALNTSIWSGSWFVSTGIFSMLRRADWAYVSIFMFTVVLYTIGVIWYAYLIRLYEGDQ